MSENLLYKSNRYEVVRFVSQLHFALAAFHTTLITLVCRLAESGLEMHLNVFSPWRYKLSYLCKPMVNKFLGLGPAPLLSIFQI